MQIFIGLHIFQLSEISWVANPPGRWILYSMCLVIFVVSLSFLQSLLLCRVHLFCVLGASLQGTLCVQLPRALRLSLVQYQTYINLTNPVLQELKSASTYEGALNLRLLMGNYCFFPHSEPKSHTFNSFTLAGRRCFSHHLFI